MSNAKNFENHHYEKNIYHSFVIYWLSIFDWNLVRNERNNSDFAPVFWSKRGFFEELVYKMQVYRSNNLSIG